MSNSCYYLKFEEGEAEDQKIKWLSQAHILVTIRLTFEPPSI